MSDTKLPTLITISEAAERLGVSLKTLRRWEKYGLVHPVRNPQNQRLFNINEIDNLANRKYKPLPETSVAPQNYLSISQAADEIGVSIKTLRRWDAEGKLNLPRDEHNRRVFTQALIAEIKKNRDSFTRPPATTLEQLEQQAELELPAPQTQPTPTATTPDSPSTASKTLQKLPVKPTNAKPSYLPPVVAALATPLLSLLPFILVILPLLIFALLGFKPSVPLQSVDFSARPTPLPLGMAPLEPTASGSAVSRDNPLFQQLPRGEVAGVTVTGGSLLSFESMLDNNYNFGVAGSVEGNQLIATSTVKPPLVVASQEKVLNLNADLLDGHSWEEITELTSVSTTLQTAYTGGNTITTAGKDISFSLTGSDKFSIEGAGDIRFNTTGKTIVSNKLDINAGLNVNSGSLVVGTDKFTVSPTTGDVTTSGNIAVGGSITGSNTTLKSVNNILLQPNSNTSKYIYLSSSSNHPGIFFAGMSSSNDPGIRVNNTTGQIEYRDQDANTWVTLDSLSSGSTNLVMTDGGTYVFPTGRESLRAYDAAGTNYFDLSSAGLGYNGTTFLSNTGQLTNVSGNISMFTNNEGYITSAALTGYIQDANTGTWDKNIWDDITFGNLASASAAIGLITDDTAVPKNHLTNSGTLSFSWSDAEVSDTLTLNNGLLYAPTSGNVGIGTTAPNYKFQVASGDLDISSGALRLGGTDVSQYFIDSAGTNTQVWTSDGTGRGYWANLPAGTVYTAGNDLSLTGDTFAIESQLDHVSVINRDSADLTLQTTTSGNIVLNPAGSVSMGSNLTTTGSVAFGGASIDATATVNLSSTVTTSRNAIKNTMTVNTGGAYITPVGMLNTMSITGNDGTITGVRNNLTVGGQFAAVNDPVGTGIFNNLFTTNDAGIQEVRGMFTSLNTYANDVGYGNYITSASDFGRQFGVYGSFSGSADRFGIYMTGEGKNYFSGNVGIGTTNPGSKLEVTGDINTTGALRINGTDMSQYFIDAAGTSGQVWTSDGSGRGGWTTLPTYTGGNGLTLNSSTFELGGTLTKTTDINVDSHNLTFSGTGNVGIGTTNPQAKLDVTGDSRFAGHILPDTDNTYDLGSPTNRWRDLYLGPNSLHISDGASSAAIRLNNNKIEFDNDSDGSPEFIVGDTILTVGSIRLTDNTIGPLTDTDLLHLQDNLLTLNGNLNVTGTISTGGIQRISNTGALTNVTGNISLFTNDANYITTDDLTDTNISDVLTLNNGLLYAPTSGNVGIGTTSPAYKLDVAGSLQATSFYLNDVQVSATATELNLLSGRTGTLLDINNVATQLSLWDQNAADDLTSSMVGTSIQAYNANTSFLGQTIQESELDISNSPSAGFILRVDGSGNMSWVDPADVSQSSNYWLQTGEQVYAKNSSWHDLLIGGTATSSATIALQANTGNIKATSLNLGTGNLSLSGATIGISTDTNLLSLANNALTVNGVISAATTNTINGISINSGSIAASSLGLGTGNLTLSGTTIGITSDTDLLSLASGAINLNGSLTTSGHIVPSVTNSYDLGSSTARFRDLYLGPSSLHLGENGNEAILGYSITGNFFSFDPDGNTNPDLVITDAGKLGIGTTSPTAQTEIKLSNADTKGLSVIAANGQIANLIDIQSSTGSLIASISPEGKFSISGMPIPNPSYSNSGGTGNRSGMITVTDSGVVDQGWSPQKNTQGMVDGVFGTGFYFINGLPANGNWIQFDFGSNQVNITEATWYQGDGRTDCLGDWRWQGSNNGTDWTNIGAQFTLGCALTQVQTSLSSNTNYYRYYRLAGVSGNANYWPRIEELEFKIDSGTSQTTVIAGSTIGIGTTNPLANLDVTGNIRLGVAGANNTLHTTAAGGAATGNLYWGNTPILTQSNIENYAVSSIAGTANQITTSANTGTVTLSLPADLRAPDTFNATTSIATGANAGTVRLDASGNLQNIGTYSGSGNITSTGGVVSMGGTGNNYFAGNVGIGITSPTSLLHLQGPPSGNASITLDNGTDAMGTGPSFNFSYLGTTGAKITSTAGNFLGMYLPTDLRFSTSSDAEGLTERMRIDASGNIGIGTTAPGSYKLNIQGGNLNVSGALFTGGSQRISNTGTLTNTTWNGASITDAYISDTLTINNGLLYAPTSGNIGIGTTVPSQKLSVAGTVKATAVEGGLNNWLISGSDTDNPYVDFMVGDSGSGNNYGHGIIIRRARTGTGAVNWTNLGMLNDSTFGIGVLNAVGTGANLLTVNSSGNVGIGTTSPTAKLSIVGTTNIAVGSYGSIGFATPGNNTGLTLLTNDTNMYRADIRRDSNALYFATSAAGVGTVPTVKFGIRDADNALYAFGTWQGAWSDARLKHDITPQQNALEKILALNPVTYYWNADVQLDDKMHYGIIAQEFQKVFPEMVYEDENGRLNVKRDELQFVLAKAIQELNTKVDQQGDVTGVQTQIASQSATLSQIEDQFSLLSAEVTTQSSSIHSLLASVQNLVSQVTSLWNRQSNLEKHTAQVQSQQDLITATMQDIQSQVTTFSASPASSARIEHLESVVTDQTASVAGIIDTLTTNYEPRTTYLETEVSTLSARITTLESQLASPAPSPSPSDLENRISELETQLASLNTPPSEAPVDLSLTLDASTSALVEDLLVATSSSNLLAHDLEGSFLHIDTDSLFVSDFLSVMGDTILTNATITTTLTVNSISSLDGKLDLLAGLVTLDRTGNMVTINGDLTINGNLVAHTSQLDALTTTTATVSGVLTVASLQAPELDQLATKLAQTEIEWASQSAHIASQSAGLAVNVQQLAVENASLSAKLAELEARFATMSARPRYFR